MKKSLMDYMSERFSNAHKSEVKKKDLGPVITISRQKGCNASLIAEKLTKRISEHYNTGWSWINKELLNETATALGLNLEDVKAKVKLKNESFIEAFFSSLSQTYKEDRDNVKRSLRHIIRTVAEDGKTIIVGRGGAAVAADLEKSLHVQLFADKRYRLEFIKCNSKRKSLTLKEMLEIDAKRSDLLHYFYKEQDTKQLFDIIINTQRFTPDAIVEIIFKAARMKGLFK